MGAIAAGGVTLVNTKVVEALGVTHAELDAVIRNEARELARREELYRRGRPQLDVTDQTAIIVDDGLATGSTMRAAVAALRKLRPARVVVGVPIAAPSTCHELADVADNVVCAVTPEPFISVGLWYEDFSQTSDDEVRSLLELRARERIEERSARPSVPGP